MVVVNRRRIPYRIPTFVKWAGGKTQLLEQLKVFLPDHVDRYFEPFVGGGALFFFVKQHLQPQEIILLDSVAELVNSYQIIRDKVDELIDALTLHKKNHSKEYYYRIRQTDPASLTAVGQAARFLYLNKTCFNGLYRVNSKGIFNVPMGRYVSPSIVRPNLLMEACALLQNVRVQKGDFSTILSEARQGDFVYFDPPYYPLSNTAYFTSYTKNPFLEDQHEKLCAAYRELDKKGCLLMQSNSNTDFIRSLYKGFRLETVQARRVINSNAMKRDAISELVILNY